MVLSAWILLNLLDALLTWTGISLGASEASPHLNAVAHTLGLEGMLLIKLAAAVAVGCVLWWRHAFRIFRGVNALMALVVLNNALVIGFLL
ncbi:MAG: DUF5658 family protein [Dehalococcoidia bacterium]